MFEVIVKVTKLFQKVKETRNCPETLRKNYRSTLKNVLENANEQ